MARSRLQNSHGGSSRSKGDGRLLAGHPPAPRRIGIVFGRVRSRALGITLVEVMVVSAVLIILASAALPLSRITLKRQKEMELHAALRRMRRAIDAYKALADQGLIQLDVDQEGYPLELDELVEGVDLVGQVDKKVKFLRRIPKDPFTGEREWGMRSYQDDFDSTVWGGQNVYDVYSLSSGTGLDGTSYSEW